MVQKFDKLFVIQLFQEKYADPILLAMTAAGLKDVVSFNTVNVSRRLPQILPIFSSFSHLLEKTSSHSKVFWCPVKGNDSIDKTLEHLEKVGISLLKDDIGTIWIIPIQPYGG